MKYYVVADVHGFYGPLKAVLEEKGFFDDPQPHKLIVCGDLFDRGQEAVQLQQFILDLMRQDEVILIRGNHEDLMEELLNKWHLSSYLQYHHQSNGTVDTVMQLTGAAPEQFVYGPERIGKRLLNTPFIKKIIPSMVDYFETKNYIFVHGWIPCMIVEDLDGVQHYMAIGNWQEVNAQQWKRARWYNGMDAAHDGVTEYGKTIVCGHWHCSYGHAVLEGKGTEFDDGADFSPYRAEGIIAIDACTAATGIVNCLVIEDE